MTDSKAIAYTYEADWHCPDCTAARLGEDCQGVDREGNEVHAVFSWDEWWQSTDEADVLACGDCGAVLDTTLPNMDAVAADGAEAGKGAASWVEISSEDDAREVVRLFEDCEYDIPAPLSGEWADSISARDVLESFGMDSDAFEDHDVSTVLNAWEDAYYAAYEAEVTRAARYQLGEAQ